MARGGARAGLSEQADHHHGGSCSGRHHRCERAALCGGGLAGFALAAPSGTPADIVQKLRDAFIKALQDPELKRRLTENGTLIHTSTSEEMAKLLAEEVESTNQLVKALGLRQQ